MAREYDLTVIGTGPTGYVAAIRAAQLGMKVASIENAEVGGICLNWGCIPTKAMLKSAEVYSHLKHASEYGVAADNVSVDFARVVARSRSVVERLNKGVQFLLKKNKIDLIAGRADLTGPRKISVKDASGREGVEITSRFVLIAAGGRPIELPGAPFDGKRIISSREAMLLKEPPRSMVIIGAGAIGVEFAYLYNTFGTLVTLIEMMPNIVPLEDEEISKALSTSFTKAGIKVMAGTTVRKVETAAGGVRVTAAKEGKSDTVEAEVALIAVGVRGNVEKLGLEAAGVKTEGRFIEVNADYQTSAEGIFAAGDVIGPPLLAHVGSAEGVHAVEFMAGRNPAPIDYNNVPACTYCQPQVAGVGLTEKAARERGIDVKVGRFPFRASGMALAIGQPEGFVKVIFDAKYGEWLGAHIIGPQATELIAEAAIARTLETTSAEVLRTIHAHPTLSEAILEAAADAFGEATHV